MTGAACAATSRIAEVLTIADRLNVAARLFGVRWLLDSVLGDNA